LSLKSDSISYMEMHKTDTVSSPQRETLLKVFTSQRTVLLKQLRQALGGASRSTVFRYLKEIPYRSSYNHNGKYYTLHNPEQYDENGLYAYKGVFFSIDGSLINTVVRLVHQAVAGYSHRELRQLLQVSLHGILGHVVEKGDVVRRKIDAFYVYFNPDPDTLAKQLQRRHEMIALQREREGVSDHIVIQVLLALIRHPGSKPADVVRYLYGHSPPISMVQVQAVFDRYDLERLGQKGGSSSC